MKKMTAIFSPILIWGFIFAHGVSESDKAEMVKGGLMDFFILGAKHMITGYDHILFLIGVIFFLTRFLDIAKFITAFTIGHSITLIFATYYEINANYYLIDAVIAFSVIYKGFENLDGFKRWFSIEAPNKVMMVGIFGLIHGFGLSTRLQQIELGHHHLISKILSFNGGVDIGQIIALIIAFPLLLVLKKKFENISDLSNKILMFAGTLLLIFQLNGYFTSKENIELVEPEKTEINLIDSVKEPVKKDTHTHKHGDKKHQNHDHHGDH
ncbi:MAG: HupE/UreJ family protein [Candidatus Marinimicrobia bacterium]|nr:HupE/UreJ family protein [Candidatus Neomarinimicrobiota bacterium]